MAPCDLDPFCAIAGRFSDDGFYVPPYVSLDAVRRSGDVHRLTSPASRGAGRGLEDS